MQSTVTTGDSYWMILFKTCEALGGDARSGDSIYMLCRKIFLLSGYNLCAPYVTLFRALEDLGGSPVSGDSIYMLRKKLSVALAGGVTPPSANSIITFGGQQIETFAGGDFVLFT